MAEGESTGKGIGGFLKGQTGPLPNWAWLLVIAGGALAAYFIPKFIGNQGSTTQPDQGTSNAGTGATGLGLAIDPTTGLPYAVEGLVPSGGTVGMPPGTLPPVPNPTPTPNPIQPMPPQPVPPQPTPTPTPTPGGGNTWLWQQLHVPGPIVPFGQYNGPSYSNLRPGTKYTYGGVTYTLTTSVPGEPGSGMLYGVGPQGQVVAITGPASAYKPTTAGHGGGPGYNGPETNVVYPMWPGGTRQMRTA